MKALLTVLLAIISVVCVGQTNRIRNLTTEPTYNGTLYFAVDRSTYTVHRKIAASTISDYINGLSLTRDTAIWNRLTALESDTVWMAGSGTQSIQAVNSGDSASANYSLSHGRQSFATIQGGRSYSSGSTTINTDGWAQCIEFTAYGDIKATDTDSLLIGGIDTIFIPNNYAIQATVKILGVAYNGPDKGLTYAGTYEFVIKQVAGKTSKTETDTIAENIEAGITSTVVFRANDTDESLEIEVTSTEGGDMYWTAEVRMVMIKFD